MPNVGPIPELTSLLSVITLISPAVLWLIRLLKTVFFLTQIGRLFRVFRRSFIGIFRWFIHGVKDNIFTAPEDVISVITKPVKSDRNLH